MANNKSGVETLLDKLPKSNFNNVSSSTERYVGVLRLLLNGVIGTDNQRAAVVRIANQLSPKHTMLGTAESTINRTIAPSHQKCHGFVRAVHGREFIARTLQIIANAMTETNTNDE